MRHPTAYRSLWIAAASTLVVIVTFGSRAGGFLVIDKPQPADVIVVLAGETQYRPARALELLDHRYAQRILLNVPVNSTLYKFTQIQLAEEYIQQLPQGKAVEICPIQGLSTRDESHDVEKCLARGHSDRVLIVTSDYHTRRSLSIFRHELPGKTFSIAAVSDNTQFGTRWWKHRQWAKTCLDEWLRLLWWDGIERWR
jgi:uncharacterized SAM-binding protein YcdF (DUF218 family)